MKNMPTQSICFHTLGGETVLGYMSKALSLATSKKCENRKTVARSISTYVHTQGKMNSHNSSK